MGCASLPDITGRVPLALALLAVLLLAGFAAQASDVPAGPSPSPNSDDCSDTLVTLLPCAPAVTKNATAPTDDCCSAIKAVSPTCVCFLLSTKPVIPDPLKDIDLDAVAKIPKACGLTAHYR